MSLYPSLDRTRLVRDASLGHVRRLQTGAWMQHRNGVQVPVRVDRLVNELLDAQWVYDDGNGYARPTPLGASIAGIATKATR